VNGTQVVSEDWIKEVTTPSDTNPNYGFQTWLGTEWEENRGYGKGVPITVRHSEPFAADNIVFFDGSGGQRVYVVPSHDLVIVRTGPGGTDPVTGNFDWDDAILPNTIINGIVPVATSIENAVNETELSE
jgi:CubicO group peptidase (beta-lactamase class C family)